MEFTSSKGIKWFLHMKKIMLKHGNEISTYFFKREKGENACESLPIKYKVVETSSGLPVIKRI